MHPGLLARNGEYAFLDRRFFDDLPTDGLTRFTDRDVGALFVAAEPALTKLEEHGALAQWFLQRLNHLSGGSFKLDLDEDLAGWFTLDVLVVRGGELIAMLEFDGSDLHIDCTLLGNDVLVSSDALQKLVRICVREFHEVQELQESTNFIEEEW